MNRSDIQLPLDREVLRKAVVERLERAAVKTEGEAFEAWLDETFGRIFEYARRHKRTTVRARAINGAADAYARYRIVTDYQNRCSQVTANPWDTPVPELLERLLK